MRTVLVVDDSHVSYEILKKSLASSGRYRVDFFCRNGENLLETYAQHRPDIVTMDIVMADVNGLELTRKLKEVYPDACVVIVSALSYPEVRDEAMNTGAAAYIQKPIQAEEIIKVLDSVSGNKD